MYRSLIRCIRVYRVYLNQSNLYIQTNHLTRNISSSSCCIKQIQLSQITDDLRDVPNYVETKHRKLSKLRFIGFLTTNLSCQPQRATEICVDHPKFSERTLQEVSRNVDFLTMKGVTQTLILDNPWMLILNHVHLSSNIRILEEMKPKSMNDFAPLAIIPSEKLKKFRKIAEEEANIIPNNHRIYYFSELLEVSPSTVSQHVSGKSFVLQIPFNKLDIRMQTLLKFITPEDILNNLGSLKFPESKIELRLGQAKVLHLSMKVFRLYQPEKTLRNLRNRFNQEKLLLNGRSLAQYYSDRLKLDIQMIEDMLRHYPKLQKWGTTLIDEKLDYLLNEAGFSALEIIQSAYMLTKSLKTTKARIQELLAHNCPKNCNFNIVFQNSKRYKKFLDNLATSREQTGDK